MRYSGKYEVISQLGHGSMGMVYKVRHTVLDTILALKVLPPHLTENQDLVKRFYREARVMARLSHPNIARVLDVQKDEEQGVHYFVMEYIEGQTLKEYVRERGPLSVVNVLEVGRAVAAALDYAHTFSPPVIHRDIKPTNVMVEAKTRRVVVMDFGIAKELDESEATRAGTILGTLKYCPPEQMRHEPLDGSADVYALGMVMYEIHAGMHLLAGLNESELIRRVLESEEFQPVFPPLTNPELSGIIRQAIAKSRATRYKSMADLRRDLEACWVALDENQATVIATGEDSPGDDVSHIDAQIERLAAERHRRMQAKLKTRLHAAREEAAKARALELAPTEWRSACEAESDAADAMLDAENLDAGREAIETAVDRFVAARDAAIAESLLRSAARARDQTLAARQEAERYGAGERAGAPFGQALALQARADEYWTLRSYREANQLYAEACSLFEESQHSAYRLLLQDEAKQVQTQVKAARETAIVQQVEHFASAAFWESVRAERRAETALQQDEFVQAQELFRAALTQYEQAVEAATVERDRRRQQVLQERAAAEQGRQEAEAVVAEGENFAEATLLMHEAEAALAADDLDTASNLFRQLTAHYEQVTERAAKDRLLEQWEHLYQEVENSQRAANDAGAMLTLSERVTGVNALVTRANELKSQGELSGALTVLDEARQALTLLVRDAERLALREHAEAHCKRLRETRMSLNDLRAWAASSWAHADALLEKVEQAWALEDYIGVMSLSDDVARALAQVGVDAKAEENLELAARDMRNKAFAAQLAAEEVEATKFATTVYEVGSLELRQGDEALIARRWTQAQVCFEDALEHLQECAESARTVREQQAAVTARNSCVQALQEAEHVQVSHYLPEEYSGAMQLQQAAQSDYDAHRFASASEGFSRAAERLRQLGLDALRLTVEADRREAVQLFEQISAKQRSHSSFKAGSKTFKRGERFAAKGLLQEAANQYRAAAVAYKDLLSMPPISEDVPVSQRHDKGAWKYGLLALGSLALVYTAMRFTQPLQNVAPEHGLNDVTPSVTPVPLKLSWVPAKDNLSIESHGIYDFAVKGATGQSSALRYEWFVDDRAVAVSDSFRYEQPASPAQIPQQISVVVSSERGPHVKHVWSLHAPAVPRIDIATPENVHLELPAETTQDFSVTAAHPGDVIRWYQNEREVAQGPHWEMRVGAPGSSVSVRARVENSAGQFVDRQWDVRVNAATRPPLAVEIQEPNVAVGQELTLKAGKGISFQLNVKNESPGNVQYRWSVNGAKRAEGARFEYIPNDAEMTAGHADVSVAISRDDGESYQRRWPVRLLPVEKPLRIATAKPPVSAPVRIDAGASQVFAIEDQGGSRQSRLSYRWLLDGKNTGTGPRWSYAPPLDAVGQHTVNIVVSDAQGATATQQWRVEVRAAVPKFKSVTPPGTVVDASTHDNVAFSVRLQPLASSDASVQPSFHWFVDGVERTSEQKGEFSSESLGPGHHEVSVQATLGGVTTPFRRWTINVAAEPTAAPAAAAPASVLSETDVKRWLHGYREAWQNKDVDALISLGEVTRDNAERLREVLQGYQSFSVALQGVEVHIEGTQATVTFNRIDTIDGKTLPQPDRKVVTLMRGSSGRLTRSPQR